MAISLPEPQLVDPYGGLEAPFERQGPEQGRGGAESAPREHRADLQLRVPSLVQLADQLEDHGFAEDQRGIALLRREPADRGPRRQRR